MPPLLGQSTGPTYYVSTQGSDSNPGTLARPWRTIQKALSSLGPGEIALVRAGTYTQSLELEAHAETPTGRSGTATAPITLAAYPGETPIVHSSGAAMLRVSYGSSYWRFQGLVFEATDNLPTGTGQPGVWVSDTPGANGARARAIEFRGCEFRGNRHNSTAVFTSPQTDAVHLIGNRSYGWGDGTHQRHGIYIQGQNALVADNVVYDNVGFGIVVRGNYPDSDTDVPIPARNVIVTNNTAVDNGLSGIVVENNATGITVVNNIAAFNGGYAVRGYYNGSGEILPGNVALNNLGFGNDAGQFGNGADGVIDFSDGNVVGDPLFVAPALRDYRLQASSPAVDEGLMSYSPAFDFEGRLRPEGASPDLGAYERVQS